VDFISIESGKLRLEKIPSDPRRVFGAVVERFRQPMERRRIRYRVNGLNRDWPSFSLDARRMDQVLSNLIGNALKHTPENGSVEVDFGRRDGVMEVRVTDTGAGLEAAHLPHVFEQFYQVDSSPVAKSGLGLGLSIAREIVRRHGGEIGVSSPGLNKGSTFWFTVPEGKERT
jgi:signal transduction histidine kinase